VCKVDARVGGAIRIDMRSPEGVVRPMTGRFVEIDRPHRMVFRACPLDSAGTPIAEVLNTVTFTEIDGGRGTEISLVARVTHSTPAAERAISGMSEGWSQTLDRLAAFVTRD
jgi:uncharacterized protein YndB with AHSA1/START domain